MDKKNVQKRKNPAD